MPRGITFFWIKSGPGSNPGTVERPYVVMGAQQ